jgi:hypothetical protein
VERRRWVLDMMAISKVLILESDGTKMIHSF